MNRSSVYAPGGGVVRYAGYELLAAFDEQVIHFVVRIDDRLASSASRLTKRIDAFRHHAEVAAAMLSISSGCVYPMVPSIMITISDMSAA
jgi:hypothetical protein